MYAWRRVRNALSTWRVFDKDCMIYIDTCVPAGACVPVLHSHKLERAHTHADLFARLSTVTCYHETVTYNNETVTYYHEAVIYYYETVTYHHETRHVL